MSQTISREECAWLFQSNIFRSIDQSNLICTKVLEGRSSYKGDSGTRHQQKNDFFMWKCFQYFFSDIKLKCLIYIVGGPLLREGDGTLIGVINSGLANAEVADVDDIYVQINADIRYYFAWISKITGLEMPKCWIFAFLLDWWGYYEEMDYRWHQFDISFLIER